jgi:hypothetical protein
MVLFSVECGALDLPVDRSLQFMSSKKNTNVNKQKNPNKTTGPLRSSPHGKHSPDTGAGIHPILHFEHNLLLEMLDTRPFAQLPLVKPFIKAKSLDGEGNWPSVLL